MTHVRFRSVSIFALVLSLACLGCASIRPLSAVDADRIFGEARDRVDEPEATVAAISAAEIGRASFYGPGFHGRTTASGEVFRQDALTAAHPTLAFGSLLRVTNLANGAAVMVTVNDRGPYVRGRVIDLSLGAARALGFLHEGTTRVRIERIS